MIDIDALEKLRKEATGGYYHYDPSSGGIGTVYNENGYCVAPAVDQEDAEYLIALHNQFPAILAELREQETALLAARELIEKALPKFNWGACCLDAQAIKLLNEVPGIVAKALAKFDATKG